jgi:predicted NodU family carbamoyl transferase
LPGLADQFRGKDIHFFDHHLCHAAQTYWMNPYERADVLVVDGSGGDGSSSLYQVVDGGFLLLERHGVPWSLGILYEAAAFYANLGWNAAGKLMGLSSYGAPTGRTFLDFDPTRDEFALTEASRRMPARTLASSDGGLLVDRSSPTRRRPATRSTTRASPRTSRSPASKPVSGWSSGCTGCRAATPCCCPAASR